eukprot:jgi/Chrzof1/13683/Cz08g08020.t1
MQGSTCAMVESILRHCGYTTGLFTSPHLCDVRERVRVDGQMVSKQLFMDHFWWCYNTLQQAATDEVGVPGYFRFMTLLGLKIFLSQNIDVLVLEVGIGGRLDATNIFPRPVVCGVTSLGFDHMELLGDTLPKIAREKAGIFKPHTPAYTVQQPADAMQELQACAGEVGTSLTVPPSLGTYSSSTPQRVGLAGRHQELNASLAVALAAAWEADRAATQTGHIAAQERVDSIQKGVLPEAYAKGLESTTWPGRSQVVHDIQHVSASGDISSLTFYLDGAHTPESMITCADWFSEVVQPPSGADSSDTSNTSVQQVETTAHNTPEPLSTTNVDCQRVLLFNCMKERDASTLLHQLQSSMLQRGVHAQHAVFVPPDSHYSFLSSSSTAEAAKQLNVDVSWQAQLRDVWQACCESGEPSTAQTGCSLPPLPAPPGCEAQDTRHGAVAPSVHSVVEWLRRCVKEHPKLKLHVLVTGSLYLVGDLLRVLGKTPD